MGMGGQCHAQAALPMGKRPSTHCAGGWMVSRASLDGCRKSRTPPQFHPRTVHPVARRYTGSAIPASLRITSNKTTIG